jgi:hypothetical protein
MRLRGNPIIGTDPSLQFVLDRLELVSAELDSLIASL